MTKITIKKAIEELKEKLFEKYGKTIRIFHFGSTVLKKYTDNSDIDILVLFDRAVTTVLKEKIFKAAFEIELKYDVIFGIIVVQADEWNRMKPTTFYQNVKKEAVAVL